MFTTNTLLVRVLNLAFRWDDQMGDWEGYIPYDFFKILNIYNNIYVTYIIIKKKFK